jgi:hypothetical protein
MANSESLENITPENAFEMNDIGFVIPEGKGKEKEKEKVKTQSNIANTVRNGVRDEYKKLYKDYAKEIDTKLTEYKNKTIAVQLQNYTVFLHRKLDKDHEIIKKDFLIHLKKEFNRDIANFIVSDKYTTTGVGGKTYSISPETFINGPINLSIATRSLTYKPPSLSNAGFSSYHVERNSEPVQLVNNLNTIAINEMAAQMQSFQAKAGKHGGTRHLRKKNRKGSLKHK